MLRLRGLNVDLRKFDAILVISNITNLNTYLDFGIPVFYVDIHFWYPSNKKHRIWQEAKQCFIERYFEDEFKLLHNSIEVGPIISLEKENSKIYKQILVNIGGGANRFIKPGVNSSYINIVLQLINQLKKEIEFEKYDFIIAQDMAYSEISYDGYKPISILEVDKDIFNDDGNKNENRFFLKYKMIGGFLGVWNLPKQQSPAVAAGSVIVLYNNTNSDIDLSKLRGVSFGERTEEGFGRIYVNVRTYSVIGVEEFQRGGPIAPNNLVEIKDFIESTLYSRLRSKLSKEATGRFNAWSTGHRRQAG